MIDESIIQDKIDEVKSVLTKVADQHLSYYKVGSLNRTSKLFLIQEILSGYLFTLDYYNDLLNSDLDPSDFDIDDSDIRNTIGYCDEIMLYAFT